MMCCILDNGAEQILRGDDRKNYLFSRFQLDCSRTLSDAVSIAILWKFFRYVNMHSYDEIRHMTFVSFY